MNDARMIKVGPVGYTGHEYWNEKRCSKIVQIFISHRSYGESRIRSLQFLYVDNGALVLSDTHGKTDGDKFYVVELNYPSEYLTCIRIWSDKYGLPQGISAIAFQTNLGAHGPFGQPSQSHHEFCFQLGRNRGFGGFHGTIDFSLSSLGVYVKPIASLNAANARHVNKPSSNLV